MNGSNYENFQKVERTEMYLYMQVTSEYNSVLYIDDFMIWSQLFILLEQ